MDKFKLLEKKLGIKIQNKKIFLEALTHRSYLNESQKDFLNSNERLEFLGDSILSFVISEWLFEKFPHYQEGTLTNLRSNLAKTETLANLAKKFSLGSFLFLSRGERKEGGENNPTILANSLEAILGAIYLDQGINAIKNFIKTNFKNLLDNLVLQGEFKDCKSILQEKTQAEKRISPIYKTLKETGPDHAKTFTVGVFIGRKLLATGQGKNKQSAEEEAAKKALEKTK